MRIGAHVSIARGIANAVAREKQIGGNCGQIFTHSPQVWKHTSIADKQARRFRDKTLSAGIAPWIIHSSYLVNLSTPKLDLRRKSIQSLQAELRAADRLAIPYVNVHLGAHTGSGEADGLDNAISAINELEIPDGVQLLVETDAGSGTKLGARFEHLAEVRSRASTTVGFCLDTAHVFVAGYDLSTPSAVDETVAAFDDVVGLEHLMCIHLNDARYACGSHRDVHAHLGEGMIGEAGMRRIASHPALRDKPFILETPKDTPESDPTNIARFKSWS